MLEDLDLSMENMAASGSIYGLLISTAILIFSVLIFHFLVTRYIRKRVRANELRRKWLIQTRNSFILILLLGLVLIWGSELRTLALSMVALAVALVVATKELILCVSGSILKTISGSFDLGDRIQIKDFRGDVIDQNLLATTLLEVGPGKITHQRTGRLSVIPNSLFVSEPVINESYTSDYIIHVFTVPFKREDDWQTAQKMFLKSANKHCKPYLEDVRDHMNKLSKTKGLDVPTVDPRVTVQVPTSGEVHLIIRMPTKSKQQGYVEQSILSEVFSTHDFSAKKADVVDKKSKSEES
ncbi:mechanosensitive ion channel domain-containing protein [Rhodohalobacter sp.]|uniref:mechanosensitive ion channel domain-containing protein n=1 Tax=Rhodohalobacter sp. TaxID=1974210 RepID=UPI002ACE6B2E|nr:mechanosensitive ion channel domain-containing protein [Rhodohalobacter sp.]MDZ7758110.1 mechanosensitive ion channel [Rhodohalobacter sp.]